MTERERSPEAVAGVAAFEHALTAWAAGGLAPGASIIRAVRVAVLVEGASDRAAVCAAARVLGHDLPALGTAVIPMGGAMSVRRFVAMLDGDAHPARSIPGGPELRGLCDAAERRFFVGAGLPDAAIAVCRPDLEGELIDALGIEAVERLLERAGDLRLFRTFQHQPAQRTRPVAAQLHRFFGTTAGRKEQYGSLLTAALPPSRLPEPLRKVLAAPEAPRPPA